ncbi:MAG: hypothetical protein ACT6TB_07545 [Sphingopyxis sp.]|jgi:hypothetical protein
MMHRNMRGFAAFRVKEPILLPNPALQIRRLEFFGLLTDLVTADPPLRNLVSIVIKSLVFFLLQVAVLAHSFLELAL